MPYGRNARAHSPKHVEQLADSIRKFGWTVPCLVDRSGVLVAGHGRVLAAKSLDLTEIPVIQIDHLDDTAIRAYRIADNQLALASEWDEVALDEELKALVDSDFDLGVLGFDEGKETTSSDENLQVREISTTEVADIFWISISGPLKSQAEAISRLRDAMADMPNVDVSLSVVSYD